MDAANLGKQATTYFSDFAAWAAVTAPNLVIAILILVGGWWIAGFAQRRVHKLIEEQPNIDTTLATFISSLVRYTVIVVALIAVLGQVGVHTTSIIAALSAVAIAVGLAMQGTLSNIAAGIMLVWLRPFRVGEYIEAGSISGTVQDISLFASQLESSDGVFQFVPNSVLWNTRISNFTRLPSRMIELRFGVAYSDDIAKGLSTLLELAKLDSRAFSEPPPQVFVDELGDSAVILTLRIWVATADYWPARRDLTSRGKAALEAAGLSLPFPQRDVHLFPMTPVPERKVA
jgi:small conductance mechanosensitive channel